MKLSIVAGATSQSINIFIANSSSATGAGLTGLVFNSSGLTAYYSFSGANATSTAITLATLSAVTSAYSSGGFKEIDSTNMPGWYRFDIPNAVLATSKGRSVALHFQGAANMAPLPIELELTGWDNQDSVHGGLSSLPNTAVTTNASLLTSGTGTDQISVSAGKVLLQATQTGVTIPTVTTVTNQLTAAAIATGVWQDATAGDFTAAGSIGKSLYTSGNAPGASSGLALVGSNMGTVSSVTGSVGSVTGSVGSVTGSVGSVTGNVGGNVVGSVGSVTAAVTISANDSFTSQSGTAQAGAASTITLASGASATDSLYNGQLVKINSGTGAGQARVITGYVGSTKVATVDRAWQTNPDSSSVYTVVFADDATLNSSLQVTAASVQGNVTGSVASVTGAVGSVTGNVGGSVASVTGAVGSVTGNVGGNVVGSVGSVTGAVGSVTAAVSVTGDLSSTMKTSVTSAVWDATMASHLTSGTTGAALNAAGSAGDPWSTTLPGAYGAGTAGNIIGNNLNAAITSRMATFTLPTNFSSLAITGGGAVTAGTVSDKTGYSLTQSFPANFSVLSIDASGNVNSNIVQSGTAQAGSSSSITLASSASSGNGIYVGQRVRIVSGTGTGQSRIITGYVGATKVATVDWNWSTSPDATSVYAVESADAPALNGSLQPTAASVAGSVGSVTGNVGGDVAGKVLGGGSSVITAAGAWSLDGSGNAIATATTLTAVKNKTDLIATNAADSPELVTALGTISTNLDAKVSTRSTYAGGDTAGTTTLLTRLPQAITFTSGYVESAPQTAVTVGGYSTGEDPATLVLDATASAHDTAGTIGNKINNSGGGGSSIALRTGTAQGGGASTITLDAGASATNNLYANCIVGITGGTGAGQSAIITSYVGSSKVATVNGTWATNPDNTSVFEILPLGSIPGASAPTASQVATAVWQDATAGDFTQPGSAGQKLVNLSQSRSITIEQKNITV